MIKMIIFCLLLIGCSHRYKYEAPLNKKNHEIIQIVTHGGGSCSAFVVSDTLAFTAGHCVETDVCELGICEWNDEEMIVINSLGQDTGIRAKRATSEYTANGFSPDWAILQGNFKDFNKIPVQVGSFTLEKGDELSVCGYPRGYRPPSCTYGKYLGALGFRGISDAFMVKGMSGGPVVNEYGIAVGINSARMDKADGSNFNPTFGLMERK